MSENAATPTVTGNMFLFNKPELLNKEQHQPIGITAPDKPFGFCANVRFAPLTVSEIPQAMRNFPVVFTSKEGGMPIAVLGLIDEVNLFVDDNGQWESDIYVPGYIRRYPFAVASETSGDRHAIVIDAGFEGFVNNSGTPLFNDDGSLSAHSQQAVEFCKEYENDRLRTITAFEKVASLDLIQPQSAQYTPQGENEPKPFAQYFGIDDKKLKELSDADFLELRKLGVLPFLYAQMMSMANWRSILSRRAQRFGLTEETILKQASAANLN
ncbi:MAG: SapC family protein [Pseudomonadota bacterium]